MELMRKALADIIRAFDALPLGNYPPHIIEAWLNHRLKPAIDRARPIAAAEPPEQPGDLAKP